MKDGFRTPPKPNKKEQRQLDIEVQNLQMAVRISQMMIQQLMQSVKNMGEDLGKAINQLYELQYKYSAMQKLLNIDSASLQKLVDEQRLKDFEEAAQKADAQENLETAETVSENSTIVITSVAKDENGEDKGIFRSRFKLSESGVPDMTSKMVGKKVGDKVVITINGLEHEVELLSIKNPKEERPATETTH
jgi:hypothetical protein